MAELPVPDFVATLEIGLGRGQYDDLIEPGTRNDALALLYYTRRAAAAGDRKSLARYADALAEFCAGEATPARIARELAWLLEHLPSEGQA